MARRGGRAGEQRRCVQDPRRRLGAVDCLALLTDDVRAPTLALRPTCDVEAARSCVELSAVAARCVCGRWSQVAITTDPASGPPTPRVGAVLGVTGEFMLVHATYNMQRTMVRCSASAMSPSLPSVRTVRAAIAAGPPNARRVPAIVTRDQRCPQLDRFAGSSVVMYGGYSSLSFPRRALSDTWRLQVGRSVGRLPLALYIAVRQLSTERCARL